jgi:hypothetical protein
VTVELGFLLETQIPVSDPDRPPPELQTSFTWTGYVLKHTHQEVDKWEWIWLAAHRVLLSRSRNSKEVNFKLVGLWL